MSASDLRVTLASLDLFHIVNQAQYLQKIGALRGYYTTRLRADREGIQPRFAHNCLAAHYALRGWQRYLNDWTGNWGYLQICRGFDFWLRQTLSWETDILTVLSGVGLRSFRAARRRGILTVVDCGSTHTEFQHRIVLEEFQRNGIHRPLFPRAYRERVRTEFEEADFIQIPTAFVARSFLEYGVPQKKLLQAPYGANLELFHEKQSPPPERRPFRVICPSGVNLRKGARVLAQAWRKLGWKDAELVWLGAISPETGHLFRDPLPGLRLEPWRTHSALAELYRSCDVLVLPSFEEGLARVMLEAAACGLPLIATPNTGVEEIFTPASPEGWLIPVNDVDALCDALKAARADRQKTFSLGQLAARKVRRGFSWEDYGRRVAENYRIILGR